MALKKTRREVYPVGTMVLIRHDDESEVTSGGIVLPDAAKIYTLTGRIVRVSGSLSENSLEFPFEELDRVIYDTRERIPVDFEPGNKMFLVEASKIYGIVKEIDVEDQSAVPRATVKR